jgi:hypothetical protein
VSSKWQQHLATADADWSAYAVLDTFIVPGGTRPKSCRPTDGRVEVCNAGYGPTGWLGVAQIWISGSHITQGVTKLNDTYFDTATYDRPEWRNLVMCQEVGHTLGLNHQDEEFGNSPLGSCMDYTSDPGPNQHPNQHDYDLLEQIYSHLDSFNSYDDAPLDGGGSGDDGGGDSACKGGWKKCGGSAPSRPPAMDQLDLSEPSAWGRMVATSPNGMTATFELDFGGGHRVVTFVIWAKERGRHHD